MLTLTFFFLVSFLILGLQHDALRRRMWFLSICISRHQTDLNPVFRTALLQNCSLSSSNVVIELIDERYAAKELLCSLAIESSRFTAWNAFQKVDGMVHLWLVRNHLANCGLNKLVRHCPANESGISCNQRRNTLSCARRWAHHSKRR
jgi:hypothetical protein